MTLAETCSKIELILSDVDGVMTDGGIYIHDDGQQLVKFHIRDGMGVRLWREAGKRFGIEFPLFAFTHCRDVVVEVSKAGGFGVLGAVGNVNSCPE